jgi:adenine/guanine phosphoribosyltransferase-like PRPP-binding protein
LKVADVTRLPPYRVDWVSADATNTADEAHAVGEANTADEAHAVGEANTAGKARAAGEADTADEIHATSELSTAGGAHATIEAAAMPARYLVRLHDGCALSLPLIPLPGGDRAIALLMSNQTSFRVERNLVERMADLARAASPEAIVGVPTLGLAYARSVAESIGLPDFVALGYSRKFWYDDALSEVAVSSTSPDQRKRIYLDPALLERVRGRRVVIVDDVLNTGSTMASVVRLVQKAPANVVAIVAVLTEGWQWHATLGQINPEVPRLVRALGHIPIFGRTAAGWVPLPETEASARPVS